MPALPQPFSPLDWLPEVETVPTGLTSSALIAQLGSRIKGLTLWAIPGGYQASVSLDVKNTWNIQQNKCPEVALVSCLWAASWYRL